jgi:hypothetical protein
MRPTVEWDHHSGGAVKSLDLGVGWKDMLYIDYWGHHFGEWKPIVVELNSTLQGVREE